MTDGASVDLQVRLDKLEEEINGAGKQIMEAPVLADTQIDQNREWVRVAIIPNRMCVSTAGVCAIE